jgi:hypothetical protein
MTESHAGHKQAVCDLGQVFDFNESYLSKVYY